MGSTVKFKHKQVEIELSFLEVLHGRSTIAYHLFLRFACLMNRAYHAKFLYECIVDVCIWKYSTFFYVHSKQSSIVLEYNPD